MVSTEHYNALHTTSSHFLSGDHFGFPDIEDIMNLVFSSNHTGDEAVSWAHYWIDLKVYEEQLQAGNADDMPMVAQSLPLKVHAFWIL